MEGAHARALTAPEGPPSSASDHPRAKRRARWGLRALALERSGHDASAVAESGYLSGEPATYRGDPADHPDHGVAHRPAAPGAERRHPRHPVGEGHHTIRDRSTGALVRVELALVTRPASTAVSA